MHHKIKTIRSNNHQLGSYELNKVSLSCFDDKRYISIYSHTDIAKYKTKIKNHDFTPQLWQSTYNYRKHSLFHVSKALLPLGDLVKKSSTYDVTQLLWRSTYNYRKHSLFHVSKVVLPFRECIGYIYHCKY